MHRRSFTLGLVTFGGLEVLGVKRGNSDQRHVRLRRQVARWTLITQEEFERNSSVARPEASPPAPQPGAPKITVEKPDPNKPAKSPVTIRVSFQAQGDAIILPKTFRATYGWLGIDVTHRITDHAEVTASGLVANNAVAPAGHYLITLQISDSKNRTGSSAFEFNVTA
jgi:hypothetical protein